MSLRSQKYEDFVSTKEESREQSGGSLKDFIDGSILTSSVVIKQVPVGIMIFCMSILYISLRNSTETAYRYKNKLEQEVKELKNESTSATASLMYISKRSEVVKRVEKEAIDLIESTVPPIKIIKEEEGSCQ